MMGWPHGPVVKLLSSGYFCHSNKKDIKAEIGVRSGAIITINLIIRLLVCWKCFMGGKWKSL